MDCQWGEWSWSQCSVTCGGGTQTATREKGVDFADFLGHCIGSHTKTFTCNNRPCRNRRPNKPKGGKERNGKPT